MFVVVRAKKLLFAVITVTACLAIVLSLAFFGRSEAVEASAGMSNTKLVPIYAVDVGDDNKIAITFDAAWGADKTRAIVDTLVRHNAKATFFLVSFWVEKYPEELKYIKECGMEVGNHSQKHLNMSQLSKKAIYDELQYVNNAINTQIGIKPRFFRPPFGDYDNKVIMTANSLDMQVIQWSVDSLDWKGLSKEQLEDRVLAKAGRGDIILCHNNSDHILDALPKILTELTKKGLQFVTMSDMVFADDYYIDANGIQHKKEK